MATYQNKLVLQGYPPMSVYTDDEGMDWMPISYDANSIAPTLGVTAAVVVATVNAETASMSPDGPPANWVYLIPVTLKSTTISCITYSTFMMLVMANLLPHTANLLNVGPVR